MKRIALLFTATLMLAACDAADLERISEARERVAAALELAQDARESLQTRCDNYQIVLDTIDPETETFQTVFAAAQELCEFVR